MLKYIKTIQKTDESKISEFQKKLYNQLCRPIFGSYTKPAQRVGELADGFTEKYNGDRIFIYYDDYFSPKSNEVITNLIVLRESEVSINKLFKWALINRPQPDITRNYTFQDSDSSCGIIEKQHTILFKAQIGRAHV